MLTVKEKKRILKYKKRNHTGSLIAVMWCRGLSSAAGRAHGTLWKESLTSEKIKTNSLEIKELWFINYC